MDQALTRREIVRAGLLLGVTAAVGGVGGCASGGTRRTGQLPGPVWPHEAARTRPPTPAPEPVPPVAAAPAAEPLATPRGVMPRTAWTRASVRVGDTNPMGWVDRITVHHDGLPPTTLRGPGDVRVRLEQIRVVHVRDKGWADIGYHYVIDPQGQVWEGRPLKFQGAHVADNNEHNLGVMVLGNFNEQRPTPEALQTLDAFVAYNMTRYRVPLRRVYTHQELKPTECPGSSLQRYMEGTRSRGGRLAMA